MKIICNLEGTMVYDLEGNYIGSVLDAKKVEEYIEHIPVAEISLEFIKAGVSPEDLIKLKHADLI